MITRIREVRRAKRLTLAEVGQRCTPPTTAQTIGRLETGTRTVSVDWLNRIAAALGTTAADLVELPQRPDLPVVAILHADGAHAPRHAAVVTVPEILPGMLAIRVEAGAGEYRAGDALWCERLAPDDFGRALNRDVLVPLPAGRFLFGRLVAADGGALSVLPPGTGSRASRIADAPWAALVRTLVRAL